ncbi:MAG: GNAT family N-acetyltransferase [bacterium]|nr:GNAT family N-acetyltransferase [bacterium]
MKTTTAAPAVQVRCLRTEEDWQTCRAALDALTAAAPLSLYATWHNWHSIWQLRFPQAPCWLIEIATGGETAPLDAAVILRENHSRRAWGKLKSLRTLDWAAARQPPLIMRAGMERAACTAFVAALPRIARATSTHLLSLYYMDGDTLPPLDDSLRAAGYPVRRRILTFDPQIVGPLNVDDYLKQRQQSRLKKIAASERKIEREHGAQPTMVRRRGGFTTEPDLPRLWDLFQAISRASWQWDYLHQQNKENAATTTRYLEELVKYASDCGCLDITLLMVGEAPVAGYVSMVRGDTLWLMLTCYDKAYAKCYPGAVILRRLLLDSQSRGDRVIDFGGEALDWKRGWANKEIAMYQIECGIGGLPGFLWSLKQRVLPGQEDELLRLHKIQSRADFEKHAAGEA